MGLVGGRGTVVRKDGVPWTIPGRLAWGSTQAHGTLLWGPEGPAPHFSTTSNQLPTTSHLQDRAPRAVWLALVVGFSVLSDDSMPELS